MFNRKVAVRIFEVLLCIACVVALRVTDDESRRVFHFLRNYSREWSLLNNVTWGSVGAALATVTCGGYVIITMGLLCAAATGELHGRKTECFLLGLGIILFGIVGALSLASIENVPPDLVDNAAVLGALSLVTALVFIADLLMTTPEQKKPMRQHDGTQTYKDSENEKTKTCQGVCGNTEKPMAILSMENENKSAKANGNTENLDGKVAEGNINQGFDKHAKEENDGESSDFVRQQMAFSNALAEESLENYNGEPIKFIDAEGRTMNRQELRRRTRDNEFIYKNTDDKRKDEAAIFYKDQEIILRTLDETDTPRFPTSADRNQSLFPKIVNPSVKIMQVERNTEDAFNNNNYGRYSDSSQYDNVPTRIAPGILRYNRDSRAQTVERNRDNIETLQEWVGVLRKSTTGTQTKDLPSSPTEPGYVRHTANNWPRETRATP